MEKVLLVVTTPLHALPFLFMTQDKETFLEKNAKLLFSFLSQRSKLHKYPCSFW